jgi:hypothetical protein
MHRVRLKIEGATLAARCREEVEAIPATAVVERPAGRQLGSVKYVGQLRVLSRWGNRDWIRR